MIHEHAAARRQRTILYSAIFLALWIYTLPAHVQSQNCTVTFRVFSPGETDTVYIAGNTVRLGRWNPGEVVLQRTPNGYHEIFITEENGTRLEYKVTRGTWDREAVSAEGVIPPNSRLTVDKDTVITIHVENWKDFVRKTDGGITGDVRYHRDFAATKLGNTRNITVLLPGSYSSDTRKRYPVLYMHDGQNCFDPSTSFLGIDWQADETVDSLTAQGVIGEILVVAVSNTSGRMREYADTPEGRHYMDFLINDLKPFIDSRYRTLPDRNNTAVMGSSMGGLISFLCIAYHPEIFGKAACLSTTLSLRNDSLFDLAQQCNPALHPARIYFDAGDEAKRESYKNSFNRLETILTANGFQKGTDIQFQLFEGHDHSERSWARRLHIPLIFLFGTHK
ncbi:alpha/beta hydrolase-fold protein [candidate division KSB1 bacterium]